MPNMDLDNLLLIVVGAHLRGEIADRPLAYQLQQHIRQFCKQHTQLIEIEIKPIVCSDLMYLNNKDLHPCPTISIGGPGVNTLTAYFARQLPRDALENNPKIILQLDPEFTDLRACIWGMDNQQTTQALALFVRDYLKSYLTAVVNQVEPKVD